MNCRAMVLIAL